jgi:hypothetical protein
VRAGLHTGEVERVDGDIRGLAVHVAARICALAAPREVLVSQTVKELVLGSGLRVAARGRKELKGVPGEWSLFAVLDDAPDELRPAIEPQHSPISDRMSLALARQVPSVTRRVIRIEQLAAKALAGRRGRPSRRTPTG